MCLDFKPKKSSNYDSINGRNHQLEIECTALGIKTQTQTQFSVKLGIGQYKMQTADRVQNADEDRGVVVTELFYYFLIFMRMFSS